ncbi:MAG: hypothetical protein CEN89_747 [Candidatus Berkelbacteria bacterium Licking1014_7]|uniref:Uncharacterized protein n=1 Tax=Candidatus Berkelbacteria bacterium Licking1014_7 TaxID=2017147 RepID=A0A554LHK2_9BACT|nr:MAG: hypothetical protein CEN89_747 [Candidatus Berkelbacteria bacterium Licking1014_7]
MKIGADYLMPFGSQQPKSGQLAAEQNNEQSELFGSPELALGFNTFYYSKTGQAKRCVFQRVFLFH